MSDQEPDKVVEMVETPEPQENPADRPAEENSNKEMKVEDIEKNEPEEPTTEAEPVVEVEPVNAEPEQPKEVAPTELTKETSLKNLPQIVVTPDVSNVEKWKFSSEDLSAPNAEHPNNLFDWQAKEGKSLQAAGGVEAVAKSLGTDLEKGLTTADVNDPKRLELYGKNEIAETDPVTYLELIWEGLQDVTLIVLIVAALVSIITGGISEGWEMGWLDGVCIIIAVLLVLNVSAINDYQKDRQFRKLNQENDKMIPYKVIRDGAEHILTKSDIVVGDLMIISSGDTVPADCIYASGDNVKMDESKLTGESDEMKKDKEHPFIVSSSECHNGRMRCIVVSVGENSVIGKMRALLGGNDDPTPLQQKLEVLTSQISILGAVVGVLTFLVMLIIHLVEYFGKNGTVDEETGDPKWKASNWSDILSYLIIGVTILVVAIPEGLPLAVTIALAYSVKRMMKDNNLVRHLNACETMGGANTICSDKTGTLTLGKMTVIKAWVLDDRGDDHSKLLGEDVDRNGFYDQCKNLPDDLKEKIIENACLNNDAVMQECADGTIKSTGSAIDIALLNWAKAIGIDYKEMRSTFPRLKKEEAESNGNEKGIVFANAFHSDRKRSSVVVRLPNGKYRVYTKGAPEMLLRLCNDTLSATGRKAELTGSFSEEKDQDGHRMGNGSRLRTYESIIIPMCSTGLRVIGLAYRDYDTADDWSKTVTFKTEEQKGTGQCPVAETEMTLLAFIGVQDPPREEVPDSVKKCQKAGIYVRMVTGDSLETAKAIAKQIGIYHPQGDVELNIPPGICIEGPVFREIVGGLVLPPHFDHECHCADYSSNSQFKSGYKTPDYPTHFGYPSIVGHKDEHCADWTTDVVSKRNDRCTEECKQRGCRKQMKHPKDKTEEQQYYIVKNQAAFDQYVSTLQVMARSAPTDKHLLVTGLMERRQVVAVTGDGTNDAPALSKSNVGFAMGIAGTSVAKDACDIILMDDNFTSIVKAVMWGRNVYDGIRKFLQFQLTINLGALALAFVCACSIRESPLNAIQMLWVNLIMDTFASLALATELPTEALLNRKPYKRDDSLISNVMLRNIIGHFIYQFVILMFLVFVGPDIFGIPIGTTLGHSAAPTQHLTIVFHSFVLMQCFNEVNARKIDNSRNIFANISTSYMFVCIVICTTGVQFIIAQFGDVVFGCKGLTGAQHGICILVGFMEMIEAQLLIFIPPNWFPDMGTKESGDEFQPNFIIRAKSSSRRVSQMTRKSSDNPGLVRIFTH